MCIRDRIGAALLGPRIGKFNKDENGKVVKVHTFPGHNLPLGALGVFILWFGWYGFNGAAATSVEQLGSIFLTTTIAPALATVSCMIFTWLKYGKPDVSMCLNASLAGLVAITAPCDTVDAFGAAIIGIVAGYLAGKIMRGGGFGVIVNLILGIIGGVLGGWVFSLLGISAGGILGSLITSTVGAILLLWIGSLFNKSKEV